MHRRMTSQFSQIHVFVIYTEMNIIGFKKLHFETYFEKYAFSGPQM